MSHPPTTLGTEPAVEPESRGTAGHRLARLGVLAAVASRLFGRLVGILLVVVLAREGSTDTVAVYGYLLGTATLVTVLTDLGVASIAGREVAAGRMPADGALRAALLPQASTVVAAAGIAVGLSLTLGPAGIPGAAVALTVAFVVVGGLNNLWAELLRATGRVVLEGVMQSVTAVGLAVVGAAVVLLGGDAVDLLVVVVGKEVLFLLVAAAVVRPRYRPGVRAADLLRSGLWVAVAGTAIIALWRQGTLVVGAVGSVSTLATYVVATRFLDAGVTVAHTVGIGLVPGMSALATEPPEFRRAARRYLGLVTAVGVVVAALGATLAEPLTVIPFGEQWSHAVPAVRVVALVALPVLLVHVGATLLLARGQQRWLAGSAVLGAVVGVGASVLLTVVHASGEAAVLGTGIGAVVLAVAQLIGLRDVLLPARAVPAA